MNPVTLTGHHVTLEPLTQHHLSEIRHAASDGQLWTLFFTSVPTPDRGSQWIAAALSAQAEGKALPFVVRSNTCGRIIGSTRFCNRDAANKRLEIGHTWYAKSVQRSAVNTECKLLLLTHAFEQLDCIAVEFRTDWFNQTSQRAIERLGAKRDGILRNHIIMPDGRIRDTVVYSILNSEWNGVRRHLKFKLDQAGPASASASNPDSSHTPLQSAPPAC